MPEGQVRWFRRLLRLLPADFQADYARDMERTFRSQHHHAREHGLVAVVRLWWETMRDVLRTAPREHLDQMRQDSRYALRNMARRPAFTAVTAAVLALGIGSTTSIFSIVDAALLRPVPFDEPGRLVAVREQTPEATLPWELSYPAYRDLRRDARSFEQFAAHMNNGVVLAGREPQLVEATLISANLLETLRVRPIAGREFSGQEDAPGGAAVALVSHGLARGRFGSPEAAIGGVLTVDGRATTVVGVLPEGFRFPRADVQLWLPIGQLADEPWMRDRQVHVALVVARLRDGVEIDTARGELATWMSAFQAREPAADQGHSLRVQSLTDQLSVTARPAVVALACAVILLLTVTCSSVGLLLLTRSAGRSSEMAIRLSLGASRSRLARQLLTETACLAALGAAVGVAAARVMLAFLVHGLEDTLPPLVTPTLDGTALGVAALTAAAAACACGLAPVSQAVKFRRTSVAVPSRLSRQWLVTAQVALSCALVIVASLLGRSLDRLLRVDLGFRADRLLVMRITAPTGSYQEPGDMTRFYKTVLERFDALPGVTAVTATSRPPVMAGSAADLTIEGQPLQTSPTVTVRRVLPGFFGTLAIPIVEGRDFDDRDGLDEPKVIVSASLARRFWPAGQAVGKRIKVGSAGREPWLRLVGVAGDLRNGDLDDALDFATYEPHAQRPWNGMFVMVRTSGDPTSQTPALRRALRELEPEALVSTSTMEERIAESVASRRFHATVVGAFAAGTLLLVALAVYGVLASSVGARTREIGIRAAVGASSSSLMRDVLVEGLRPTVAGLAVGIAGGALVASAIRALLFQVAPGDAWTYAGTTLVLLLVAVASAWLPARRAARIDPGAALRSE